MVQIKTNAIPGFEFVEVAGRLDTTSADLLDAPVQQMLEKGSKAFLFDLSELEYISSYGIRIFVKVLRQTENVALVLKSESVISIFKMSGLTKVLSIHSDLKEAIKKLNITQ